VTDQAVAQTLVAPYNVVPSLDSDVACVIVEPVAANMGLVAPVDGFLEGLRAECDRVGALLIVDEVITGFRVARGGGQELLDVAGDLSTFGKVIGGGCNIGAYGGRADVMACVAPLGPVYQAGTLSGNPLATAAGLAALDLLDGDAYARLTASATRLAGHLRSAFATARIPAVVPQVASLVGVHLSPDEPTDYASAQRTDTARYAAFFHAMLDRGVALAPGAYEVLFPGLAHTDDVIDRIGETAHAAAQAVAAA
jgi:glutamate-1-semialdehyde 2,1-aminomutase